MTALFLAPLQGQVKKLPLRSDPKTVRMWTEAEKTLIKTSSAGICCLTAVYIFTQACIIMVCLVCRSSQKLFRSPGVWKAFKHFIPISPLWYKIHAWAKENHRDKHNNWHLLTNFFFSFFEAMLPVEIVWFVCVGETRSTSTGVYFTSPTGKISGFYTIWSDLT